MQFDGVDNDTLLDDKYWLDKGVMANALKQRRLWSFFAVMGSARRQLRAARGQPIRWHIAGKEAAEEVKRLFALYKLPITVVLDP